MDGFVKKLATKFLEHKAEKYIDRANISEQQKQTLRADMKTGVDLVSTDFENGAKSGVKVLAAVLVGFASGGPVNALSAGWSAADQEGKINTDKFLQNAAATGWPIYVNGQLVNPEVIDARNALLEAQRNRVLNTAAVMGSVGLVAVGGLVWWMLSDSKKQTQ
jgi:hypothetical protein